MERCKHMLKVDQCAFCTGLISKSTGSRSNHGFVVITELWLLNFIMEPEKQYLDKYSPERKFDGW